jgi:NhaP-type Na+/H+ or K+/H+ antiporter
MLLLAFALTMVTAVVLSAFTHRTMLSSTVLFFAAGICVGPDGFDAMHTTAAHDVAGTVATIALFTVLVTDGSRVRLEQLRRSWRLPARALVLGIPITIGLIAIAARYVAGLPWLSALLLGAVLSPTDPTLASAIVGRERVPERVRWLINAESGANDGLALPAVIVLAAAVGHTGVSTRTLAFSIPAGAVLGVAVPWIVLRVASSRPFGISDRAEPLAPAAAGLLVYAIANVTDANLFLAGFAAGITIGNIRSVTTASFHDFADPLTDVAKLTALFVFGALVAWSDYITTGQWRDFALAAIAIFAIRPLTIGLTMIRSGLTRSELAVAAWFGPRGFASVVYGLYVLQVGGADAQRIFRITALVVGASIVLHSSTDVIAVRRFSADGERDAVRSHRLLDTFSDQPRVDRKRSEEADDHRELHEKPVRKLRRLEMTGREQDELH